MMETTLQGLYITIVGMGLLFLALGLILVAINILGQVVAALAARADKGEKAPPAVSTPVGLPRGSAAAPAQAGQQGEEDETLRRARVAAIAVALALARAPGPAPTAAGMAPTMPGPTARPEPWVILGRQAQMAARQGR